MLSLSSVCAYAAAVPGQPSVTVSSTATTISLSWSIPSGSVVDSYEVVWERDTSGECPDEDEGSATITDSSTSYTITGLEEDSSYTITVTATNAAGSAASDPITGMTREAGEGLHCKNKGVMVTPILGVKWLCKNDTTFGVSNGVSTRLVS